MQTTELHSPAKINLGLDVHHRRAGDGYHLISSIFIPISFGDSLFVSPAAHDSLQSVVELPIDLAADYQAVSERADLDSNLIWRALQATSKLRSTAVESFLESPQAQGWPAKPGLKVEITKRIPTGGGLGGGSSNAGTLLGWIRQTFQLDGNVIHDIALQLGADVPFFLERSPALVSGIGEIRQPIAIGPGYGVLCVSGIKVETGIAYKRLKRALQETPPPKTLRGLDLRTQSALQEADWATAKNLKNDFEPAVFAMHPELAAIKAAFYDMGAAFALMSGSGATVYGLVASAEAQAELLSAMQTAFPEYHFWPFDFG